MVAELEPAKFKETFTIAEVHEREKPLMLQLNAYQKEVERLKAKLSALHFNFNGIYNDTLNPMGKEEKNEEKKRLVAKSDTRKNRAVMRELVYDKNKDEVDGVVSETITLRKLTFFEKLKGLFNV